MMLGMTQPTPVDDILSATQLVQFGDRTMVVKQLNETQMMHLMKYSRLLQQHKDGADREPLFEAVERVMAIVHSSVKDPDDRQYLIRLEEEGEVTLQDLLKIVKAFTEGEKEGATKAAVVRRGRARRTS